MPVLTILAALNRKEIKTKQNKTKMSIYLYKQTKLSSWLFGLRQHWTVFFSCGWAIFSSVCPWQRVECVSSSSSKSEDPALNWERSPSKRILRKPLQCYLLRRFRQNKHRYLVSNKPETRDTRSIYRWQIFSALQHLPFHHSVLLVALLGREFDFYGACTTK